MTNDQVEVELGKIVELNPKFLNKSEIDEELEVQFLPMKLVEEVSNKIHLDEIKKFNEVQKKSYTYKLLVQFFIIATLAERIVG